MNKTYTIVQQASLLLYIPFIVCLINFQCGASYLQPLSLQFPDHKVGFYNLLASIKLMKSDVSARAQWFGTHRPSIMLSAPLVNFLNYLRSPWIQQQITDVEEKCTRLKIAYDNLQSVADAIEATYGRLKSSYDKSVTVNNKALIERNLQEIAKSQRESSKNSHKMMKNWHELLRIWLSFNTFYNQSLQNFEILRKTHVINPNQLLRCNCTKDEESKYSHPEVAIYVWNVPIDQLYTLDANQHFTIGYPWSNQRSLWFIPVCLNPRNQVTRILAVITNNILYQWLLPLFREENLELFLIGAIPPHADPICKICYEKVNHFYQLILLQKFKICSHR